MSPAVRRECCPTGISSSLFVQEYCCSRTLTGLVVVVTEWDTYKPAWARACLLGHQGSSHSRVVSLAGGQCRTRKGGIWAVLGSLSAVAKSYPCPATHSQSRPAFATTSREGKLV